VIHPASHTGGFDREMNGESGSVVFDNYPLEGELLPADYLARIATALDQLSGDPATPPGIARLAERCVWKRKQSSSGIASVERA
jgi:hypothetical protein